jgi:peptidylprolyl isomerase
MFAPHPELDNNYTVMGRVLAGMDVVDAIAPGEPPEQPTKIVRAYLGDAPTASAAAK